MKTKQKIIVVTVVVLVAGAAFLLFGKQEPASAPVRKGAQQTAPKKAQQNTFNKKQYSTTDPASIWVVVNKQHPLQPVTYKPSDLRYPNVSLRIPGAPEMQMRAEPATALEQLFAAAQREAIMLQVTTAYRGYSYQKTLYDGYVTNQGQVKADEQSARPGYSEHQTGLAVDIRPQSGNCYLEACFGETPEGIWLAANAYQYGFMIRYPQDKQSVTGYHYEPWHIRYVGKTLSQQLHATKIDTLETFFNITGGQTYLEAR